MFRPFFRRSQRKPTKRPRRDHSRQLFLEPLENRRVLAGVVNVDTTVAGDLTLTGNVSNNHIEVKGTGVPGQMVVTGKSNTLLTLNGSAQTFPALTVNGITDDIFANLGHGQDRFELGSAGIKTVIGFNVSITNQDDDTNIINNVDIGEDLSVAHTDNAYAELQILRTIIRGDALVDNNGGGGGVIGTGDGDSKTLISESEIEGTLTIENADGDDSIVVGGTSIGAALFVRPPGVPTIPVVEIANGDGGSLTSFTLQNDPDQTGALPPGTLDRPTVFGGIDIVNGDQLPPGLIVPPPVAGGAIPDTLQTAIDIVVFNQVELLGDLDIVNNNGHTQTVFVDSQFAMDTIPIAAGYGASVTLNNSNGYDVFLMDNSSTPYGLYISNGGAGQTWGSQTDIRNSEIGDRLSPAGVSLSLTGDDGDDVVNLVDTTSNTQIQGGVALSLLDGEDSVTIRGLAAASLEMDQLSVDGSSGDDDVFIQNAEIVSQISVLLDGGADTLEIRTGVDLPGLLVGIITLDGGVGADFYTIPVGVPFASFEILIP